MKKIIKRRSLILLIFVIFCGLNTPLSAMAMDLTNADIKGITDIQNMGTVPELTAAAAVLIDADTGQVLYDKNCHEQKYPASTTKVMTALLAIENLNMEQVVTIDKEVAETSGSSIYLEEGEQIKVQDLLYALMLKSANDAAVALAKAVSGSVEEFANLMNEKAISVGARNTHFNNPNGLPDDKHYTSAYDLAMITKAGFSNDYYKKVVSTIEYTISSTNLHAERPLTNGNKMLWDKREKYEDSGTKIAPYYEGTNGVKTGYTKAAGNCLIASVKREGHELIGVVLGSEKEKHYVDMIKLMDYGFNTYDSVVICKATDHQYEVKVKKSEIKKIDVGLENEVRLTLPAGTDLGKVKTNVSIEKKYEAPVSKNQTLGKVDIYYDNVYLCTGNLVALKGAAKKKTPDIQAIVIKVIKIVAILAVFFIILYLIILLFVNRIYKAKRNKKNKKNKKSKNI